MNNLYGKNSKLNFENSFIFNNDDIKNIKTKKIILASGSVLRNLINCKKKLNIIDSYYAWGILNLSLTVINGDKNIKNADYILIDSFINDCFCNATPLSQIKPSFNLLIKYIKSIRPEMKIIIIFMPELNMTETKKKCYTLYKNIYHSIINKYNLSFIDASNYCNEKNKTDFTDSHHLSKNGLVNFENELLNNLKTTEVFISKTNEKINYKKLGKINIQSNCIFHININNYLFIYNQNNQNIKINNIVYQTNTIYKVVDNEVNIQVIENNLDEYWVYEVLI